VKNRLTEAPARFDVVAVLLRDGAAPFIEHIPNAFDLAY
jgi:putative endonuclease